MPLGDGDFMNTGNFICEQRGTLRRRLLIGKSIDVVEPERFSQAVDELDQFRFGRWTKVGLTRY